MRILEKLLIVGVLLLFAALTAWLEQSLDQPVGATPEKPRAEHEPDYYIENFVATGLDAAGRQYVLESLRLAHFPHDDTSLLDQPHVIQYAEEIGPRHVYADSGLISADGTEVLLRGNVKVIESRADGRPGNVTTTDRMRIRLKKKPGT